MWLPCSSLVYGTHYSMYMYRVYISWLIILHALLGNKVPNAHSCMESL